jgi:hypothetical protein
MFTAYSLWPLQVLKLLSKLYEYIFSALPSPDMTLVSQRRFVSLLHISAGLSMEENGSQVYRAGTAYQQSDVIMRWFIPVVFEV